MAITVVRGFRWAGFSSGIKKSGDLDLGLLVADGPVPTTAVLTQNRVRAAPVSITEEKLKSGMAQAVIVNSGNANACTGHPGLLAAHRTCKLVANRLAIPEALVVPASTGVIGELLPVGKIERALPRLVSTLSPRGVDAFSRAILTTDSAPKVARTSVSVSGGEATILGVAKGAGMIHPNMATTLSFVVTDALADVSFLRSALRDATDKTFNSISVDGDTSTNDTILLMASGRTGSAALNGRSPSSKRFVAGLEQVLAQLASMIVADGEGAEHAVRIEVMGARTNADARMIAQRIATSPLVKTALYGQDPNWGRIVAAAGATGAKFNPDRIQVSVGEVRIVRNGIAVGSEAERKAKSVMKRKSYTIAVDLGGGPGQAHYMTCDLGTEYVRINAGYRT